jgi:hypothetical protein
MQTIRPAFLTALVAAGAFIAPAQTALDQLKAYGEKAPSSAAATPKYDIVGINLGMPIKDALLALKAHSPNFRLQPDSLKFDFLPTALTYGISATSPAVVSATGRPIPSNSEKFYFLITMPPSQPVVSKLARLVTFSKESAPTQDVVAADLEKKYGQPSYDSGPPSLNELGARDMFWVDDQRGNRLRVREPEPLWQCGALTTFRICLQGDARGLNEVADIQINPGIARSRMQEGYATGSEAWAVAACSGYTMVRARLFDTRTMGTLAPGLVGGMLMIIGSGPLDRSATDATRQYVEQAARARAEQEKEAAKQNRPKL